MFQFFYLFKIFSMHLDDELLVYVFSRHHSFTFPCACFLHTKLFLLSLAVKYVNKRELLTTRWLSSAKCKLSLKIPAHLALPSKLSRSPYIILSRSKLKRVDERIQPCLTPTVLLNQSLYAFPRKTVAIAFEYNLQDESYHSNPEVILLQRMPDHFMPYPIEGPLEVNQVLIHPRLVVSAFFTDDPQLKNLLH